MICAKRRAGLETQYRIKLSDTVILVGKGRIAKVPFSVEIHLTVSKDA